MALPASGPISSSQIATELAVSSASFSANSAELLVYTDLNALSISSSGKILNIDTPNSMSEWYNYTHNFKVSSSKVSSSAGLLIPSTASYNFVTFAQFEMSTSTATFKFSGSNFIARGAVSTANVPYSLYYGTYSLAMSSSKQLLQTGNLNSTTPSLSYNYVYNAASGSIITLLFKPALTSSAIAVPTPYVKYDQFSSSISASSVWNNLGTAGATYNLKGFNLTPVSSSGTGTGSFIIFNTGSIVNQYMTGSGFNIGAKDFTYTVVFRPHKWYTNNAAQSQNIITNNDSLNTGFYISSIPNNGAVSGSGTGYFPFQKVETTANNQIILTNNTYNLNNFYHFTYVYNSTSSTAQLYQNATLINTLVNVTASVSMNATSKQSIGGLITPPGTKAYNIAGIHLATFSCWTGSGGILSAAQVTTLNNEYKLRYTLV